MKKIILSIMLLIICASTAFAATRGLPTSNVNIDVTLVNQDPDPVEPGEYVDLRFLEEK